MRDCNPTTRSFLKTITSLVIIAGAFVPALVVTQEVAAAQGTEKPKPKKHADATKDAKEPQQPKAPKEPKDPNAPKKPKEAIAFYNSQTPITVTLTTNIGRIKKDKGDNGPWRPATLSYTGADGKAVVIPIKIHTRGIWRQHNCEFPPIRLNFSKEGTKGTVFAGLKKPKLVSYCRDDDTYEQYIIQEYQAYRIYGLLTDASHKARLLHVAYTDSASGKVQATRAAILLEEPEELASRYGTTLMKEKGAGPEFMEPFHNALLGVFEYMIGNTDWSIFALHNIELLSQPDGNVIPVPMDFDFSGIVNARYATADPKLNISGVRERLYRGYCGPTEEYTKAIDLFKQKKDSIYGLYADSIGKMMRKDFVENTLKYYDDFYKTINDSRAVKREIVEPCVTGR
jgi:hypothetical protein